MATATMPPLPLPIQLRDLIYHEALEDTSIVTVHKPTHTLAEGSYGVKNLWQCWTEVRCGPGEFFRMQPLHTYPRYFYCIPLGDGTWIATNTIWMCTSKQVAREAYQQFRRKAHWAFTYHRLPTPLDPAAASLISPTLSTTITLSYIGLVDSYPPGFQRDGEHGFLSPFVDFFWLQNLAASLRGRNNIQELTMRFMFDSNECEPSQVNLIALKSIIQACPRLKRLEFTYKPNFQCENWRHMRSMEDAFDYLEPYFDQSPGDTTVRNERTNVAIQQLMGEALGPGRCDTWESDLVVDDHVHFVWTKK